MNATINPRFGIALLSVLTVGFLITALAAHPAELPRQPVVAACTAQMA